MQHSMENVKLEDTFKNREVFGERQLDRLMDLMKKTEYNVVQLAYSR